jgi:effector-binding domain-containing protein/DNA-binding transcriptional MerR regulator
MFSIGEFSRITGLSIKALRLYHEKGILVPGRVDDATGYRYYNHENAETARIINHLRGMDFSLSDIGEMLAGSSCGDDVVEFFEKQINVINARIERQNSIANILQMIIKNEKECKMSMQNEPFEVEEKELDTMLVAGVRFKGRYNECGNAFAKIGKTMGMNICGKAMCLYYDGDYKEEDADIEACMPIRKGKNADGINVRELSGGLCTSLIHKGPYSTLSRSYEKITAYIKEKGCTTLLPCREVYIKGPGMIFRGKAENYLTEIQILIKK